uniref:DUF4283 domain-containing protein n=1 Tax=Quercus lobata TaxID=97700 RepID=A0A7N2MG08_QUELO
MFGQDLKITNVGDRLIQFKFAMESQLLWVVNNGPWSFDNHILLLRHWEKGMTAFSVQFLHIPIWVQVWGLPFDLINVKAGRDIGSSIGRVVDIDCKAISSEQVHFLRIRVEMPIDKPIRRGAPVISPEGDRVWVAFQYERLLGLYFNCSFLGHEAKKEVRGRRTPSPPRRNMEEHIRRDKNPPQSNSKPGVLHGNSLTATTVIEPGTSNGNSSTAVTITEIVDKKLAIIPRLDGYDSQLPCTSEINERNPEIMVHTDVIGIKQNTEKIYDSWISIPIMYEENLVDNTLPISSKPLPDLVISSLSHDQARGTNKIGTVLSNLVREKAPKILFLMETKQTVKEMRKIQADLHYHSILAI